MKHLTAEQQAKHEARKAHRKDLIAKLKAGEPIKLSSPYTSIKGHSFSDRNSMLLALQGVAIGSIVAGFGQWKQNGRSVKKGEQGSDILIPLIRKGKDDKDEEEIKGFGWSTVFHFTQTEELTKVTT